MKILSILSLVAVLFVLASCDDDCSAPATVIGEWNWVKSVGGLGGHTITPASVGYTKHLVIDDHFYTEYIDDSIDFHSQYDLQVEQDSLFETPFFIRFDLGGTVPYKYEGDQLEIIDVCEDCYRHFYSRK